MAMCCAWKFSWRFESLSLVHPSWSDVFAFFLQVHSDPVEVQVRVLLFIILVPDTILALPRLLMAKYVN